VRRAGLLLLSLLVALDAPVLADSASQRYAVDGEDSYRIAGSDLRTDIVYAGTQLLTIEHRGGVTQFTASVSYDRRGSGGSTHATGSFTSEILPSGEERDESDHDPDYLTVLNQPFAVQLDPPTLSDLRLLTGTVPFDFPSPMTGAPLHGSLRRLADGTLDGRRVLGIAFSAQGPLQGSLPDRPEMSLSGTITMNGTAYYAYADALLLALDATLQIDGRVANSGQNDPVSIVYKRTLRPLAPAAHPGR
jgi:hypothetical protein